MKKIFITLSTFLIYQLALADYSHIELFPYQYSTYYQGKDKEINEHFSNIAYGTMNIAGNADLGMQVNNSTEVGIGSTGLGFKVNF